MLKLAKLDVFTVLALCIAGLATTACPEDDDVGGGDVNDTGVTDTGVTDTGVTDTGVTDTGVTDTAVQTVSVAVTVTDAGTDAALSGVSITVEGKTLATTDASGEASIEVADGATVSGELDGYAKSHQKVAFVEGADIAVVLALTPVEFESTVDITAGATVPITTDEGMVATLTIPQGSLVDSTGAAVTGMVDIEASYTAPAAVTAETTPAPLIVAEGDKMCPLKSEGLIDITIKQDGHEVDVKDDEALALTLRAEPAAPETLPLWSFDEEKGIWVQEDTAINDGDTWNLSLPHLSWFTPGESNCPESLTVTVTDAGTMAALSGVSITVDGMTLGTTDAAGEASIEVADGATVSGELDGYAKSHQKVAFADLATPAIALALTPVEFESTVDITAGATVPITTDEGMVATLTIPQGSLVDSAGAAVTGMVDIEASYTAPAAVTAETAPAPLTVAEGDKTCPLKSEGLIDITIKQDGERVDVKEGEALALTVRAEPAAPETLPLWSFDEEKGIWVQEDTATNDGDHWAMSLPHLSWFTPGESNCPQACGEFGAACCTEGDACQSPFTCDTDADTCGCPTAGGSVCGTACCDAGQFCKDGACEDPTTVACLDIFKPAATPVNDACVGAGDCPATCNAALAAGSTASGIYWIKPGAAAAFKVQCDMSIDGGGWTLVGFEAGGTPNPATARGMMAQLHTETGTVDDVAAATGAGGFIGPRFAYGTNYGEARLTWCTGAATPVYRFQRFVTAGDLFANTLANAPATAGQDNMIVLTNFTSNDADLNAQLDNPSDAAFCRAFAGAKIPGDTSWGVKQKDETSNSCGCNSGGWQGQGSYYGGSGLPAMNNDGCGAWGGGWAGTAGNGVVKGNVNTNTLYFWIR
ncbi:MAG: hypothetical protein ACI9MR_001867 [Myxococcota bacterium]|jgi:hypothetical protein